MNILEAFNELDQLEEAFAGNYKSPYLNITDAERQAAQQQYEQGKNYLCRATAKGMTPVPRFELYHANDYARRSFHFVLDYEAFHKAYDKELERAGLLTMFEADGSIGPRKCYGNIMDANLPKTDPAYKAAIELWAWQHGEKEQGKRWNTISAQEAAKLVQQAKDNEARYQQQQAAKEAEATRLKADTAAANAARAVLEDILIDALDLIDTTLADQLEELGNPDIAIARKGTKNYLYAEDVLFTEIPILPHGEYTPEYLGDFINQALAKANLTAKIEQNTLGLTAVRKHAEESTGYVTTGYWLDVNNIIYINNADYTKLINQKTGAAATPKELSTCELALVICKNVGRKQTYSATEDVHSSYYYSYNEERVQNSDLLNKLPVDDSYALQERTLNYYDQGFEQAHENSRYFMNFSDFDVWLEEKVTDYGNG
jgi:hypothetical protein